MSFRFNPSSRPVCVVGHVADETGLLAEGHEAALHGGHGHNVGRVQVDDALDVGAGRVDGRVEHEAGLVHAKVQAPLLHHITLQTGSFYHFKFLALSIWFLAVSIWFEVDKKDSYS